MLLVGLTGGIGSGKSTVADLLARHGAVILDADAFARDAVRSGSEPFAAVVRRFGQEIVSADGELDRAALAAIVFADREALADLEAIIHPEVRRMIADGIQSHLDTDDEFWDRMHAQFSEPELVELGCMVGLTLGQQSWLRMLNIDHHEVMPGTDASMAPGFESREALEASKSSADYWAKA